MAHHSEYARRRCEKKCPACFLDDEVGPAAKQRGKPRARITTTPELDDGLQEVLINARQLVAKQGKDWVSMQVLGPTEQEPNGRQRADRPRRNPLVAAVVSPGPRQRRPVARTVAPTRDKVPTRTWKGSSRGAPKDPIARRPGADRHQVELAAHSDHMEVSDISDEDESIVA
ncbi:hypothetical protein NDU88_005824 [Pleurodeles waltl]|uniref:Uncharacterized protein n=1 Tax=Pleurodeles waltl TaxID=8319 RepID=A0AAV7NNL9_PLEWA|nr:hypothetical protein NDU88_005824 [Pleurodeles waltl]